MAHKNPLPDKFSEMGGSAIIDWLEELRNRLVSCEDATDFVLQLAEELNVDMRATARKGLG